MKVGNSLKIKFPTLAKGRGDFFVIQSGSAIKGSKQLKTLDSKIPGLDYQNFSFGINITNTIS